MLDSVSTTALPVSADNDHGEVEEGALDDQEASAGENAQGTVLFVRTVPASWTREDIIATLSEAAPVEALSLSEPKPQYNFSRLGWALFRTAADCTLALEKCNGVKVHGWCVRIAIVD